MLERETADRRHAAGKALVGLGFGPGSLLVAALAVELSFATSSGPDTPRARGILFTMALAVAALAHLASLATLAATIDALRLRPVPVPVGLLLGYWALLVVGLVWVAWNAMR